MKEKIERWYNSFLSTGRRLWTIEMVATAVDKGVLSPEDFKEITGEVYSEEE